MKKMISNFLVLCFLVTAIWPGAVTKAKTEVYWFGFTTKSNMNSITLKWDKQKGVKYYKIYKKDITKTYKDTDKTYKKKSFKKLAKVTKKTYKDKKVKRNRVYIYYIDGYNKKGKVIYSTYTKGMNDPQSANIFAPWALNRDNGEDESNTPNIIRVEAMRYIGVKPDKYIFYRKAKGEKKFKKIGTKKYKSGSAIFEDKTVKPLNTYKYKMKAYKKYKKKSYYSKFSDEVKIKALNSAPKYRVESITRAYKGNEAIIKLTSADKYNGATMISDSLISDYCYKFADASPELIFYAKLTGYSMDNNNWMTFGGPVRLDAEESIYLKFKLEDSGQNDEKTEPVFGGNVVKQSIFKCPSTSISYYGSSSAMDDVMLDLVTGEGTSYKES